MSGNREIKEILSKVAPIMVDVDIVDAIQAVVYETTPETPQHVLLGYNPRIMFYPSRAHFKEAEALKDANKWIRKTDPSMRYKAVIHSIRAYAATIRKGGKAVYRTDAHDDQEGALTEARRWAQRKFKDGTFAEGFISIESIFGGM